MSKVFIHTRTAGNKGWDNTGREFLRLPVEGEYLALDGASPWYKVELVVHCPFEACYSAEVYAVEVDLNEVMKAKLVA